MPVIWKQSKVEPASKGPSYKQGDGQKNDAKKPSASFIKPNKNQDNLTVLSEKKFQEFSGCPIPDDIKPGVLVFDRASFTYSPANEIERKAMVELLNVVQDEGHTIPNYENGDYKYGFKYKAGSARVLIQFHPKYLDKAYFRFEWNPARLSAEDSALLKAFFDTLFLHGINQDGLRFTRLDFALDFPMLDINNFLFYAPGLRTGRHEWGDSKLETIYLGSPESQLSIAAYDKAREQGKKGNVIPKMARIEFRFRPENKLTLITLKDLPDLHLFEALEIYHVDSPAPSTTPTYHWRWFLDSAARRGLKEALRGMPKKDKDRYLNHFRDKATASWWTPKLFNSRISEALQELTALLL